MIGLVLVTHGRLAAEFVTAMEHVVGPQEAIEAICIGPDDDMEDRRKDIAEAIGRVEQGQGVIILTDLFGGTPSNLAISLMKVEKDGHKVCGTSIMGLMMLGAAMGDTITIHVTGAEADAALEKLVALISEKFGEE